MAIRHRISAITALVLLVAGCGNNSQHIETRSIEEIHQEEGVPVVVEAVTAVPYTSEYSYFAVLSGIEQTSGSAMIADKVDDIRYKVGDFVKKDAIVVTFPTDNPSTQYYQAKVSYEHALTTVERLKTLYENGGISLQEYENTRTQYDVAKANWDAVQQSVAVQAPISGILTNLAVRESDNVQPGDVLFTISNMKQLQARIWVSESQINDVSVGDPAIASWRDVTLEGKVAQVDMSLEYSRQAYGVVVEFDNSENRKMNGVNAEIVLQDTDDSDTIIIERKNMDNDGDSYFVYLAQDDVAVKRVVTPGRSSGLNVEIIQGLAAGDRLITEGQMLLRDNTKIHVMNEFDLSQK